MSRRRKPSGKGAQRELSTVKQGQDWYVAAALAVVLLTTLVIYMPALNGGLLWDDDRHIPGLPFQSAHGLYLIWSEPGATQQYFPLLHSAFWLEYKLWGDSVFGYHLVTLLWHMLAVVLVYLILTKLKIPGALLASAIFAVHPVMVESVAWIAEQKNTLSLVFYLAALLAYLDFDKSRRQIHYLLSLGMFVCALLSKTTAVTLVPAILIIIWWQRGTISLNRDFVPLLPFLALGIPLGLVASWIERTFLGTVGPSNALSFTDRFLVAGRAVWFYLGKLVWPSGLIPIYPRWAIDPSLWWQWAFPLAALALTAALAFATKWSRAPLAAWLFFCATLFPVIGFFNGSYFQLSCVADHFAYVASLGIIALAAAGITLFLDRLPRTPRLITGTLCVLVIAVLAILTMRQSRVYRDAITFYETTIDRNPNCWIAHYNLGSVLFNSGEHQKAIEHTNEALRLKPDYAPAEYNLATFMANTGRPEDANVHFENALRLHPDYFKAEVDFGTLLLRQRRTDDAIAHFQKALELKPNDPAALNNLAVALLTAGRTSEAIEKFEYALQFDPENLKARHNLGMLLEKSGKIAEAIEQFQIELRLDPKNVNAYSSIAEALAVAGRSQEALQAAQKAIEVARSTGQTELANQMEAKLKSYQATLGRASENPPKSTTPNP